MGEHLIVGDFADDEALTDFYHTRLMVPRLDPNLLARIPRRIIQKIPADMAAEFRVIPVAVDRDQSLTLAMSDPSDTHAVDEISFFTGCYVMRAVATQRQLAWCLAHYYGHVTMLGETLLEPSPELSEPTPGAAPEPALSPADGVPKPMRGPGHITQQIEASRHRVQPPVAPGRGEDQDEDDDEDTDAGLVVYDDDDEGAGAPDDTVEVVIEAEPPTGPTGPTHQKYQEPNPPELSPRAGEVVVRDETDVTPSSSNPVLPAVLIADDDPDETIVALNDDDEDEDQDQDGHVVILDRPARSSSPPPVELVESGPPAAEDPVLILDTPKKRRRAAKQTRVGLGIFEAAPRARSSSAPPISDERQRPAAPRAGAVPEPVALTEANATGRHARINYDEAGWDDGFGPPGTTIPPPYLGAMPDTEATGPHNAIPINLPDDESGAVSVPVSVPTATPSARIVALAETLTDAADSQRELDESAIRLVETLRALDGATTRDAIVEALLDHMTRSFGRATFFVVKGNDLVPFRSKGVASMAPGWKNAGLSLEAPSTIRDVVQARLPFRGPVTDEMTRGLMMSVMGRVPDEVLLLPCTVRERPVGVLCGAERSHRIFHEHLSVISRGAGQAFERILKARKG